MNTNQIKGNSSINTIGEGTLNKNNQNQPK